MNVGLLERPGALQHLDVLHTQKGWLRRRKLYSAWI